MKFGLMPSSSSPPPTQQPQSSAAPIHNTNQSIASTSPSTSPPLSDSRKSSFNNNNNNCNQSNNNSITMTTVNATSDFNQWLHAMKMVARLPGGTPPEFRRKLWLALADRHLHTSGIDWNKEQTKCLSNETWLDDDEELGTQIVKDLHRTGSSLFSGPNGHINQAKLKRVLLGYARWNPEVGYCQGFNMLGALILQVMERSEIESLKVMIYLIEGVLPKGYFSGSLGGLQADMAVFRDILSTRMPKLSKHLQKLQGTIGDNSMDPPLINVFTMQWFLTLFCTCLPKSCVLRVWDLVLIEGSDILLRTALAIMATISERLLAIKSADEFYSKMGTLSAELLNGHLFDSNGLIQRVVDLGPIADLHRMREKQLFNVTPWKDRKGLRIFYVDEDSDDENLKHLTGTRKTHTGPNRNQIPDTRERIALDISLLKKQYSKLRERQRHSNLPSPSKQIVSGGSMGDSGSNTGSNSATKSANINQYLIGRNAIVSNKKRHGPPAGSIPPVRTTLPMSVANKYQQKRLRNATIDNTSTSAMQLKIRGGDDNSNQIQKKKFTRHRSESSSYSEDSDKGSDDELDNRLPIDSSSSSTSLCDDEFGSIGNASSIDASPMKSRLHSSASDDSKSSLPKDESVQYKRFQADDVDECDGIDDGDETKSSNIDRENNDIHYTKIDGDGKPEKSNLDLLSLPQREAITSTSQLSPIENISTILSTSTISPLKTPTSYLLQAYPLCDLTSNEENNQDESSEIDFSLNTGSSDKDFFKVSDEGVTNAYFERINHVATVTMDSKFPFSFIEDAPDDTNLESRLSRSSQEEDDDDDDEDGSSFKSEVRRLSDSFESAIILIDQADKNINKTSPCTSSPNTNSDAILKMIEENSKILDRIMCKNAQATANSIKSLDKDQVESIDQNVNAPVAKNDTDQCARIPTVEITSHEAIDEKINQSDVTPSMDEKDIDPTDAQVFKYGDLSDCISKYLISTNEKADQRAIHADSDRPSDKGDEIAINKSNESKLNLPKTLSLLSNEAGSTEDIRALLEESFHGYCKSPSELLPIDSKLENDLETLLKMSAELLHDYPFEPMTLVDETNTTASNDVGMDRQQPTSIDSKPTTTVFEESKDMKDDPNEKSTYFDADALQMEMESVAGDISATISSIKNTIKSIDSLCQEDDRRSRTDKTLDDIIKVVEKLDEEKDNRKMHDTKSIESAILSTVYEHTARPIEHLSSLDSPRLGSRISRDRSRLTSPRRRKDDDFGEYDSRARRAKSPSSSIFNEPSNRYSDDISTKFKFDDISSGSDSGSKSKLNSPYKMAEKLEIRHTTVTATFYDRFLSQKYEQQHKSMDRSPSSPVINKAYLNSLKPTSSLTSSYSSSSDKYRRDSRSTSPIPSTFLSDRNQLESSKYMPTAPKSGYLHLPQFSLSNRDSCTRSCDNILSNLSSNSSSSEFMPRYSYQTTKTSSDIFSSNSSRSTETENLLKRHSTGTYYQNSTILPIKPKKPSEIGIKLGLYKPE